MNLRNEINGLLVVLILLFEVFNTGCGSLKKIKQEVFLEVFYVPFEMSTEGQLLESEVRDLSIPYVSYYCTSNSKIINEFKELAFGSSRKPEEVIKDIAPYMVIDYLPKSKDYEKVIIGPSVFFKINGKVYLMSKEFKDWIGNNFPKATFPVGSRVPPCGK